MVEHTRTLDFKIAFAIGLGTMIAAGIFSLSGTAVAAIGSSAVIAFVIAAVIAGVTASAYSEFASIYAENGGGYLFSSRTFEHDTLVYAVGSMLFLGYTGTTAFYLATMDEWVFRFVLPEALHFLPHGTSGVVVALLLGALNARGTEESGTFQLLVTGAKVAVLLAFIAGAFTYHGPSAALGRFAAEFSTDALGIVSIAALAFITFFGFSAIAASAGEIIKPRKTVPRAIAASILTVTALYALVIVAMVNSPVPAEIIAQEGETAMGRVAASFLGPVGRSLIVAGAIFSMVSASNASILAASGIGSLMGRQGQAPRRFSRLHQRYGTPFWSIVTATVTIVALITCFIGVFPAEDAIAGLNLGLTALTGFATFNLLLPLAVVNVALIYSRRRYPDLERGFRMPLVPILPVVGVVANLGLIWNLPRDGVAVGVGITALSVVAYLAWGGRPHVEDLFEQVAPPLERTDMDEMAEGDSYRVLVPVARPDRAPTHVRLAAKLATLDGRTPVVKVLTVTQIRDQATPDMVRDTAVERTERIREELAEEGLDVEYTVEGHICRDVAFDIIQTARDEGVDQIVMGYPDDNPDIAETVEYEAPCGVLFASGGPVPSDVSIINVGAGGGPHHRALLPLVNRLGQRGSEVHVISVDPVGGDGHEPPDETLAGLTDVEHVQVHNVSSDSVAEGLVSAATENGGLLIIGATRDRRLRRWVLGSTPDRVIDLARDAGVPVLVYASSTGVSGRLEDFIYPIYRYLRQRLSRGRSRPRADPSTRDDSTVEATAGERR